MWNLDSREMVILDIKNNSTVDNFTKLIKYAEMNKCLFYKMEHDKLYLDIPKDINKEVLSNIQKRAYDLNLGLKLNRI